MRQLAPVAQGSSDGALEPTTLWSVSEPSHGKRGTVRLDPSATVPEAIPALRFVESVGDLAAADSVDLERQAEAEKPKDPRHKNDRKEFVAAALKKQPRPTVEMGTVDVSRADPRQAPTQQVSRLPLVDRGYDPSREDGLVEPPPKPTNSSAVLIAVLLAVAGLAVAAYLVLRR